MESGEGIIRPTKLQDIWGKQQLNIAASAMKIALVTTEFYPFRGGGIGTYCESMCRALVNKGYEVHVITSVPGPDKIYGATIHRCSIPYVTPTKTVPSEFKNWELNSSIMNYTASYFWAKEIQRIVEKHDIDIIECQDCTAPIYFYLYKRLLDSNARYIPVVVYLHTASYELALWDQKPMETPDMHMICFMEDFSISMAEAVVAPSRFLASRVSDRLPAIKSKLDVIPLPAFEKNVDDLLIESRSTYKEIVYVGRLEHRKGIEVLVNALTRLMENDDDLKIRFIGKSMYSYVWGMQYLDWIRDRLSRFSDRVIFDGVLSRYEILSRMRAASCVVIPSIGENFPNVCMEAMLCGSVIIASDQGGMSEMMGGEENGFLFEGSNVESLMQVVERVLALPELVTNRIRESASARIKDFCDIDKIIIRRISHYQKVMNQSKENKQSDKLHIPVNLICGQKRTDYGVGKIGSVAVVVLNDGSCPVDSIVNSIMSGKRTPDELLILCYGTRKQAKIEALDKFSISVNQLWTDSNDLSEIKNYAAKNISSDAVIYLKTTDTIDKEFIKKSIDVLNQYPEVAHVQSWVKGIKHIGNPIMPFFPFFLYNHCFITSLGMIRRSAMDEVNGFSPGLNFHYLDWQFVLSLMERGWVSIVLDEILAESEIRDHETRESIELGVGNIMYKQLVEKNGGLFESYKYQLLVTAGSLLSVGSLHLNNRLSKFERKGLRKYRVVRNVIENTLAKIPLFKKDNK